jgi:hypothetical protein
MKMPTRTRTTTTTTTTTTKQSLEPVAAKKVAFTSKVMENSQLMDYMISLHIIDFISLDNEPLYCITLWVVLIMY